MKITPQLLAAVAVVAIGGAVSGAAIGDSPVLPRSSQETLPQAQVAFVPSSPRSSSERPPNHYPLKTQEGTVPVAELALHGRYRDTAHARSMMRAREAELRPAEYAGNYYDEAEVERLAYADAYTQRADQAQSMNSRYPDPQQADAARVQQTPAEVVATAPADTVEIRVGNAKSIDVAAALENSRR